MKFTVGIDIGFKDDTVAVLMLFVGGSMYVLDEKGTSRTGENKLTLEMKEKICKIQTAYTKGYIDKDTLSYATAKILHWNKFTPTVYIDGEWLNETTR